MPELGRILIADDEETFLFSTADLLRREGYECDCAAEAKTAAEMLRARQYDLLISDIKMPGNSELELIREIPNLAPGVPVILVTGYPSLHSALKSFQLPVSAYLAKPIDLAELLGHVHAAIDRHRAFSAVKNSQQRLHDWRAQLHSLEQSMQEAPRAQDLQPSLAFLTLTLHNIVGCLADLKNITEAIAARSANQEPCQLLNCPRPALLTNAILDTIEVLEKTKNSFKSKELGELRKKLEAVVKGAENKP
jgi:DNA-binding response OmpR family regulator